MSVASNSPATSANVNAAFISKTSDSTTVGIIGFNAATSGDAVTNIQLELNGKTFTPYVVEQVTSGGSLTTSTTKGMQRRKVTSDGGAVVASSTPFGTGGGWVDGTQVRLRGDSDTNTLKIIHADTNYGIIMNGDIILEKWTQLTVEWDEDELRWYEISRNS